jgi:biopolymer transport protein ExbD
VKRIVRHGSWPVGFNMTPMVDVVFLLIIFFLAVNQFQKAESEDRIDLPSAARANTKPPRPPTSKRIVINVRPGEGFVVAGHSVPPSDVPTFLAEQRKGAGEAGVEVWIRSDDKVPFGQVEPILLACAQSGIWNVGFKVMPEDEP